MAVNLATSSDFLKRLTNIVQPSSAYTCVFWFNSGALAAHPLYQTPFITIDDPATYSFYAGMFLNDTFFKLEVSDGSSFPDVNASLPSASTWYPLAYTRNGNIHSFYVSGVLIGSSTLDISAGTFGQLLLGNDTFSEGNLKLYGFKEWNTALSAAQILAEINSPTSVIHTSNLVTFTPLTSDLLDISGNGNNWTAVGSPSFIADPTFPSHSTFGTAQVISALPYSDTDSSLVVGGFCFDKWYKITTVNAVDNWSIFPFGDLSVYEPEVNVFNSLQQQLMFNSSPNVPINFPSYPISTDYYFQVTPSNTAITSGTLTFSVERFSPSSVPIGSIAIPNDGGYDNGGPLGPLTFVDPNSDYTVLAYINNFPVGEQGSVMSDGTVMVSTDDDPTTDNQVKIFDSSFNLVATITVGSGASSICNDDTNFYVGYLASTVYKIQAIAKDGTSGTLYNVNANSPIKIAISPDSSKFFYQKNGNTTVHTWTLATDSAGSDFFTGSAHTILGDLLCLSNGDVIFGDVNNNAIYRYNSSGTLQVTITPPITLTGGSTPDRLAYGADSTSFLAYLNHGVGIHPVNVVSFQSSDGSVLYNRPYALFSNSDGGVTRQNPTATPYRFGPSGSCPLWLTRTVFAPNFGTLVVGKASNPLASGVDFTMNVSGQAPFVLQTDTAGETLSLPAGTYSVTESAQANYQPTYFVSNDTTNNNLAVVITADQLVDVVVVNTLSATFGGLYQLVPGKTNDTLRNQDGSTTNKMISWFWELFTNRDK